METYFHNDPRIRKWLNQIIETIFTVCILTGTDSDEEFRKGCQIVMKLTSLLKDTPSIPSDFLADGVRQLLEQQLPDARVINNFPEFQNIMDRMLREGISKVTESSCGNLLENSYISGTDSLAEALEQAEKLRKAHAESLAEVRGEAEARARGEEKAQAEASELREALAEAERRAEGNGRALAEVLVQAEEERKAHVKALAEVRAEADAFSHAEKKAREEALAFADVLAHVDAKLEAITKKEPFELAKPMAGTKDYFASINAKITQLFSTSSAPQQAERLKHVLNNIFPKSTVYWNKRIMGQTFLAQVEDILICLYEPEDSYNLEEFNTNGWKVLICKREDLAFPRRLERQLKQIQRSKNNSSVV